MDQGWTVAAWTFASFTVSLACTIWARRVTRLKDHRHYLEVENGCLREVVRSQQEDLLYLRSLVTPTPPKAQPSPEPDPNQDLYDAIEQAMQDYEKDKTR